MTIPQEATVRALQSKLDRVRHFARIALGRAAMDIVDLRIEVVSLTERCDSLQRECDALRDELREAKSASAVTRPD